MSRLKPEEFTPMPYRQKTPRTFIFSLFAVLLGITAPLLALEIVLHFLPVASSTGALPVDDQNPVIRYTPNQPFTFSKGWKFDLVNTGRINNYGYVNDQDYAMQEERGPIVIIGDSYVEALMVPYKDTVQGRLAETLNNDAKVYSIGISGSQLPQYLAFAQFAWAEFHPRAMAFVIVGNDFDESLSKYKSAPGYHYFEESGLANELKLVRRDARPSLGKRLLRRSALVRYLWGTVGIQDVARSILDRFENRGGYVGNTDADASETRLVDSRLAVDCFFSELPKRIGLDKSRVLFIVDAMRPAIYSETDLQRARGTYFDLMRRYFLEAAKRNGYEAIDMEPRFIARHRRDDARFEFAIDGHWNGLGHQEAAEAIASSHIVK